MTPRSDKELSTEVDQLDFRRFDGSESDVNAIHDLWLEVFPEWPIDHGRLTKLLLYKTGHHFLHQHGFCLAFLADEVNGKIAAIGVLEAHRGRGIGTGLLKRAQSELKRTVRGAGMEDLMTLEVGSGFPRFWPEVPSSVSQEVKDFFLKRGFRNVRPPNPTARDLYRDIRKHVAPAHILERIKELPVKFTPWSATLYEECMIKQRENFGRNAGWIMAYERLAAANQHHEVMVAFDSSDAQIGWTLMCSPSSVVCQDFAFLPLMPSGEKTGLIACVGVNKDVRGQGVGLALLVKAMENMKERGVDGVMIDWVVIRGFYETLGFEAFWEYEGYEW